MARRGGLGQLGALIRSRAFVRPVSLSPADDDLLRSVMALMADESKSEEETEAELVSLRNQNPRRFRRVTHCYRTLCDPKEDLDDKRALALVESVAFGLREPELSDLETSRLEAIGQFTNLPVEEQWRRLVARVPELDSLREEALDFWVARGRPRKVPRRADEAVEVLAATRPLHRRAKELIRAAVSDRSDPLRSASVEELVYSWIDAAAFTGQPPIDPDDLIPEDDT